MLVLSSSLDREVQAHKHFTGATNIYWLNELMRYVRSEGLLNNFRLYPMVARTNYGTGVTVRGLGKLTGNQMTLVNGPTWGASGLEFASASSQYGTIADFLGSETLTVINRCVTASDVALNAWAVAQYNTGGNQRSWGQINRAGGFGDIQMNRSADGTTSNLESYAGGADVRNSDIAVVSQWIDGGGRSLWHNKTAQTITLTVGTDQTSRLNSTSAVTYACFLASGSPSGFWKGTGIALAFLTGSVTTTQRETITDLINAL